MHKFGQVEGSIGGIHYPFMEVLGHCKSILSMGNLEGKLLWNNRWHFTFSVFKYLHKLLSIDSE